MRKRKESLLKEKKRRLGLNSFYYFLTEILWCKGLASFHRELCDFVQYGTNRQLILVPRGHLKTSIITIAYAVWRIINDPNIRIYIGNEKIENASSFLSQIEKIFEYNERLKNLYGDYVGSIWSANKMIVKKRTIHHKEPTVQVGAVGSSAVSQHYDLMILDDLVSRANTASKELIETTIIYYQDCYDLIEPRGKFIILGTRWCVDDLYGWLIEHEAAHYELFWRQAIRDGDFERGELLFPQKFTREILKERLAMKGSSDFSAQYLNDPYPAEAAIFKERYFNWFDWDNGNIRVKDFNKEFNYRLSELNIFTAIDPALSQKQDADFSVIATIGVDKDDNWYLLEMKREHYTPTELADEIFLTYVKWKPRKVAIEIYGFQQVIKRYIEDKQIMLNYRLPLEELKYDTKHSKEYRIQGLIPRMERKKLYFNNQMENLEYLLNELKRFPKIKHDDCLDAMASLNDIAKKPLIYSYQETPEYKPSNPFTGY